jgi:glycosyltransferase involved in cell wall biosynthesis
MIRLSVYTVTLNEEKRLSLMLEKASIVADEIVVVDSGSTDGTEAIAKEYGARFISNKWESIGHQVSFAENCCENEWVLLLAADEVLSDGLVDEILDLKKGPKYDGYKLRIGDVFPGIPQPKRWVKHYKLVRLYNRSKMKMSGRLGHDDVVFIGKNPRVTILKNFVRHFSYLSVSRLMQKRNKATDEQVKRALLEGKCYSPWRMVGAMTLNFLKCFFLYRYFLYGFWGFLISISVGHMRFLKFAKFFEYRQLEKFPYPGRSAEKKNTRD